jgi:hypothetical protein
VRARYWMIKGFATGGFDQPTSGSRSTINGEPVHTVAGRARFALLPPMADRPRPAGSATGSRIGASCCVA